MNNVTLRATLKQLLSLGVTAEDERQSENRRIPESWPRNSRLNHYSPLITSLKNTTNTFSAQTPSDSHSSKNTKRVCLAGALAVFVWSVNQQGLVATSYSCRGPMTPRPLPPWERKKKKKGRKEEKKKKGLNSADRHDAAEPDAKRTERSSPL